MNGQLYAQVDREFKKRVRSLSLGSGSHFSNQEELPFFERKANTLTRRNAYGVQNKESALTDVKLSHPRLQYITADEMECPRSRGVMEDELKSMDLLLEELGRCSTLQHTPSRLEGLGLSDSGGVTGGSRSLRPPGVPVRNAASFDAGSRYNRNGTTGLVPNGFVSSAHTSNATSQPSHFQYSGNSIPNGYIGKPPRQTSSSVILHEPPLAQTSPPLSPLSPKFYATQMTPRTFKAKTVTHTTLGYNPARPALDATVRNGSTNSQAAKQTSGTRVFDFNNNTPTNSIGFFDVDDRKEIEDSQTLPEKGNVKSKIALLTDMLQTDKEQQTSPHQLLKCQIIPMPGLTDVSPSDVFKEISSYNAQSLAPGELSQSTGTLYSSKAPPKRIIEPSKHVVSLENSIEDIDYVAVKDSLKHIALPDLAVDNQKTGTFSLTTVLTHALPSLFPRHLVSIDTTSTGGLCDNAFIVETMHTNVMCLLLCFLNQIPTDNILFTSLHQLASMASVRRKDSKSKAQLMTAQPTLESLRHRCMFPSIIYRSSSVSLAFGLRDE